MALSWRAGAVAALGIIPVFFFPSNQTAWAWLILSVLLAVADAAAAVSPRELAIHRQVEDAVRADEQATSTVRVTNPTNRPVRVWIRDAWPPSTNPLPSRHRATIPPGAAVEVDTVLTPRRRGTRKSDRVTVRVWGPLGVAGRQLSVEAPLSLAVLPEFRARRLLPSRLARLHELEGTTATVLRGPGTEFDSLRNYVRGDDPRDIDWRASARSSELVVRTWRPERDRHVVLILDCGRTGALLLGAPRGVATDADALDLGVAPRMDAGIEACLLLAALADRAGDQVHFLAMDRAVRARVSGVRGPALLKQCASSLVDVAPSLLPVDWEAVVAEVNRTVRHSALVVLLTELPPAGTEPELFDAVRTLSRRHRVVLASAQDPTLGEMVTDRDSVQGVFGAAAATSVLRESSAGAEDMTRGGVVVIDADAGRLAARLSDTYLDLKKAGLL